MLDERLEEYRFCFFVTHLPAVSIFADVFEALQSKTFSVESFSPARMPMPSNVPNTLSILPHHFKACKLLLN
jgi:hypothetical protein